MEDTCPEPLACDVVPMLFVFANVPSKRKSGFVFECAMGSEWGRNGLENVAFSCVFRMISGKCTRTRLKHIASHCVGLNWLRLGMWNGSRTGAEWVWNETSNQKAHYGGKGWTAKLNSSDSIWEYDNQSDANTKMSELDNADSTNRRYKVVEV